MLGFSAKLPIFDQDRQWVDEGFHRLERLVGRRRMLEAKVVLPTAEDFPDPYDKTPEAVEALFRRVCVYMQVDRTSVQLEIFADETEELKTLLPHWRGNEGRRAAGVFLHHVNEGSRMEPDRGDKSMVIAIRSTQLKDPLSLVATIAHELGHVILLGGRLLDRSTSDHEPMTDLLTVFLGLGVFNANSAARFRQYQEERRQGWSMQRLGYLPEEVYGYALAKFALERGEAKPEWARHLCTNVRSYFKQSHRWLKKNTSHFQQAALHP